MFCFEEAGEEVAGDDLGLGGGFYSVLVMREGLMRGGRGRCVPGHPCMYLHPAPLEGA